MTSAKTIKDRQDEIKENIVKPLQKHSRFSVWDAKKMDYHLSAMYRVKAMTDIERSYMNYTNKPLYADSLMFILKAIDCLTYASSDQIFRLLSYWRIKDQNDAMEEGREPLCIPHYEKMGDLWEALNRLGDLGVLARYEFYEKEPSAKGKGKPYFIYKVPGNGVMLYKTVLCYRGHAYDPKTAFYKPEDSFACCLTAGGVSAFLSSPYLIDLSFNQQLKTSNKAYKMRNVLTVNEKGAGGNPKDDWKLIIEGVTFRTNPVVVKEEDRKQFIKQRVEELFGALRKIREKQAGYIIFVLEDSAGLSNLISIIGEVDVGLLKYCLFTTGSILDESKVCTSPENVRNCFLSFEGGKLNGATGFYFLEWEAK